MWRAGADSGPNDASTRGGAKARRTRMKRLPIISVALAATLFAAHANAEELTGTLKKVKETGAITIGYRDSSIPFSYLDDNQKPIGFAIDICLRVVEAVKKGTQARQAQRRIQSCHVIGSHSVARQRH